jgi:hypothetical protein
MSDGMFGARLGVLDSTARGFEGVCWGRDRCVFEGCSIKTHLLSICMEPIPIYSGTHTQTCEYGFCVGVGVGQCHVTHGLPVMCTLNRKGQCEGSRRDAETALRTMMVVCQCRAREKTVTSYIFGDGSNCQ